MDRFDVVVVGGGIHGAGVAQAAAAAGYTVLLIERAAIASGTSSRSSKLIHGGLRYLEQGAFGLVREALVERARLIANAPGLVRWLPFHIPVYADMRRGPATIRLGLSMYAVLGGLRREAGFRSLPESAWDTLDGLRTEGLCAVFRYHDAQTDDARLTRAVVRSAESLGALVRIGAAVERIELVDAGARVSVSGDAQAIEARAVVNAAGPWVDRVLESVTPTVAPLPAERVQGTHLVLPGVLTQGGYYIEAADRRAVFALPWGGRTLIGTTETPYHGDPAQVEPLPAEIDYLVETFTRHFPRHVLPEASHIEAFAGLRVLPADARTPFARARETRFAVDREMRPRLLSLYGGKLTTYRATAARVMRRIAPSLPPRTARADTRAIPLISPD